MKGYCLLQDFLLGGRICHFGGVSHRNHAFRDYRVRADKFQLSKCNARCVGGGEGEMCER